MANQTVLAASFIFVLAFFSNLDLSTSSIVHGKISCLDCHRGFDFSVQESDKNANQAADLIAKQARFFTSYTSIVSPIIPVWLKGIKILLKCDGEKKPVTAMAVSDGGFKAELVSTDENRSRNCLAKLLGGPEQLYAHKHSLVSKLVKSKDDSKVLTTLNPLVFSLSCPKPTGKMMGDSKTFDFPGIGTGGFGFPPISYFPFIPIIGIP